MAKKILLVEDEALIALSEARLLQKHGYEVSTAYNGAHAVEAVTADHTISLILMDIDLGKGMDGTEAAEKILEQHDLPIVFLSSHTEPAIVEKTEGITSYGYIVKNSGETVLLASIKMAFRLWESEDKFRKAFEHTSVGMALTSASGELLKVNKAFAAMLGYSKQELLKLTIDDVDLNFPSTRFIEFWNNKPEGSTVLFETIHIHKSGNRIPVEVNGIFFLLDGKKYLFGVSRDLTEKKRKEEDLRESEEKYRLLFDYSNDAIFVHSIGKDNLPNNNIAVNEQAARLLQYSREELLNMSAKSVMPENRADEMLLHAQELMTNKHLTFETENIRKDGVIIPIEVSAYLYTEGKKRFVVSSVRDITTRRKAEAALQKAIREKDFLMRELNHRVKNNLSMVSALISLQYSESEIDLSDLKCRIDTIRLVHEKLQHYKEIDRIEVKEYFQELLETIFSSTTVGKIHIVNQIEELSISTKTVIALGLIVNEIATNAIKYGFNLETEAEFTVSLTEDADKQLFTLKLSNSGNAFPEDIDIENTETTGLQLISILVHQLAGKIELEKRPTPHYTITFPIEKGTPTLCSNSPFGDTRPSS
ncbi:MAG: PAS domain S-box protein [Spirochaetota bacterium]